MLVTCCRPRATQACSAADFTPGSPSGTEKSWRLSSSTHAVISARSATSATEHQCLRPLSSHPWRVAPATSRGGGPSAA